MDFWLFNLLIRNQLRITVSMLKQIPGLGLLTLSNVLRYVLQDGLQIVVLPCGTELKNMVSWGLIKDM